jgi:hypothetical protein
MQAFGGMVERTGLWATDFRYLNDSRELTYTWEPFVQRLRDLSADEGPHAASYAAQLKALELMNSTDLMLYDDSIFVACFTELDDAVSQWSRYGANGHGVAMGFDSEAIQALKAPFSTMLPANCCQSPTRIGGTSIGRRICRRLNTGMKSVINSLTACSASWNVSARTRNQAAISTTT